MPNTEYALRIQAQNSLGVSEMSHAVTITTKELLIAEPIFSYDSKTNTLLVTTNSTDLCVFIEVNMMY